MLDRPSVRLAILLCCAWATAALGHGPDHDPSAIPHDADTALRLREADGLRRVERLKLPDESLVDLELRPVTVVTPKTRFVLGRVNGADIPLDIQPQTTILQGRVIGQPQSTAFVAIGSGSTAHVRGWVTTAGRRYGLHGDGGHIDAMLSEPGASNPGLDVPLCGTLDPLDSRRLPGERHIVGSSERFRSTRVIELAIETDYEYFALFGDIQAAADYVVQLYAAVNAIFERDLNVRFELTYVRLWNSPEDLFDNLAPLSPFRSHWRDHMGGVQRDVAQFLSGRRNFPYGGAAYLNSICSINGYSVVGYVLGYFPDPEINDPFHYDINVTAHELGHNCGTVHTHDINIDDCNELDGGARRGTIMSYCSQTVSGGNAVTDLRFHVEAQERMRNHLSSRTCLISDCNGNGVDDEADTATGASADDNTNGMPDECEDCNGNDILDDADILAGAQDLDNNGIPDVCEPDCNGNEIPDQLDIAVGAEDLYGDGIPDECDTDCDGDGMSDYNQIVDNMPLDLDRDGRLDACQDCDDDGTLDADQLAGANNAWVASQTDTPIREFHARTGVVVGEFSDEDGIVSGTDVLIAAPGVLVVSSMDNRIARFGLDGTALGDFIIDGVLSQPFAMTLGPDGNDLFISNWGDRSVVQFDFAGEYVGHFVASGAGELVDPTGLAFGPNGNLFVGTNDGRVLEFDGETGAWVREFVSAGSGGLSEARGMLFNADGNLLVVSHGSNAVLEFDGVSGAFRGQFNKGGTLTALTLDLPWGIRRRPGGGIFVTRDPDGAGLTGGDGERQVHLHVLATRIYEFEAATGNFINSFILGQDTTLNAPSGFDFAPNAGDCNYNGVPDECDSASDLAMCSSDCNGNGRQDVLDILPHGLSFDCNFNNVPDECEMAQFDCNQNGEHDACEVRRGVVTDCDLNGLPDTCQQNTDCNDNGIIDVCDIGGDESHDCNNNWIPDECEEDCNGDGWLDSCQLVDLTLDTNLNGVLDDCDTACVSIISSFPPHESIDARQPTELNGEPLLSAPHLIVTFAEFPTAVIDDFTISVVGSEDAPPELIEAVYLEGTTMRLQLDRPLIPGTWTTIELGCNEESVRLGHLPADVDGDGTAGPLDILALVDHLNSVVEWPSYSTDMNRSGVSEPQDILRVIDLLNGAGEFEVWNGRSLP
jgi:outer membrane protein assembly factor BamB